MARRVTLVELGGVAFDLPLLIASHQRGAPIFLEMFAAAAFTAAICAGEGVAAMCCTEPTIAIAPA